MIPTPKLSHLPFDTLLMGGIGFALGKLGNINERLSATILGVASIANTVLYEVANRWARPFMNQVTHPYFSLSSKALYAGTNAFVSTIAVLAAQNFALISRRTAGLCLFVTSSVFLARLHMLR